MDDVVASKPVSRRLGYALKRAQHALRLGMDEALRGVGLTTPQYAVLVSLAEEPGLSNAALARRSFVTPQTMIRIVAGLEQQGLVSRRPSAAHGRVLETSLTSEGARSLRRADGAVRAIEAAMVEGLPAAEADRLTARLTEIADRLRPAD